MHQAADRLWTRFGAATTLVMTLLGWSSVPLFLKHFSERIDPWTSNGWRYGFSALLWLPVLVWGLWAGGLPRRVWKAALVPAVLNAGAQTIFCIAHYKIDPGLLTFGLRSNIVFTTIGAALFFAAERRTIRAPGFLLGIFMVIGGTSGTILLGDDILEGATLAGVLLAIASGAGFAAYALSVRHFMHGMNPIQAFAAISLYTAAVTTVLMLIYGDNYGAPAWDLLKEPVVWQGLTLPGGQFTLLLISAIIGIALGHVFYYYSISKLGVAVSSGVVQLQPFFVAVASYWLFQETLSGGQWASGAVAVAGAVAILWSQQRSKRTEVVPLDQVAAASQAERD